MSTPLLHASEALAKRMLDGERLAHSIRVGAFMVQLAQRYGEDIDIAQSAGLVHDIFRQTPVAKLRALAAPLPAWQDCRTKGLLHGPVAAAMLRKTMPFADCPALCNAVEYHTTGRANMTTMEQILFLADKCELGRAYAGVGKLRRLALTDLHAAMRMALENSICMMKDKNEAPHPNTIAAIRSLEELNDK